MGNMIELESYNVKVICAPWPALLEIPYFIERFITLINTFLWISIKKLYAQKTIFGIFSFF